MISLLTSLADVIAPARCVGCLTETTWLCQDCAQDVRLAPQYCIVCNRPQPRGATCPRHQKNFPLAGVISAGSYGSVLIRRGVHWLKFKGVTDIAPLLAALIAPHAAMIAPLPVLQREAAWVPIPLHRRRARQRGFNQSLAIAQALQDQTSIPVADILVRKKSTQAQAKLPAQMRVDNVSGAFALQEALVRRRYYLLVDDVATTGSTLVSAAEVLQAAGADQIWGLTAARG